MRPAAGPRTATLLVFGMLFLRGLIPAGFMLAPVDGSLAVVLCEPDVLAPAEHRHAGHDHAGHDHTGHDHAAHDHAAHQHDAHGDPSCPYAQSAGSAPLPTLPLLAGGGPLHRLASPAAATQTVCALDLPVNPYPADPLPSFETFVIR